MANAVLERISQEVFMLKSLDKKTADFYYRIRENSRPIVENLVCEKNIPEKDAYDLFYTSDTFAKLSDESTCLYQKTWQEVYDMLKKEVSMT